MIQFVASILMAQMPSLPSAPPLPHTVLPEARDVPPPPVWWLPWAIGLLVIVLLALIIWLLIKPKAATAIPARQPISSALRALADLRARVTLIPPTEMSHRVSQILRRYLSERYTVPATARTSKELFDGLREFAPGVPIPRAEGVWRERFAPVARLCDDISFMPTLHTPEESLALIDQATARIEEERV